MSKDIAPPNPFPEEDYDRLSELLDLYSPLDLDGVLGLLHAIAVAPSVLPDEAWLRKVLRGDHASGDTVLARYCIELLVRLKAEVQDAVDHGFGIMPEDDEVDECAAFATGYVAGAELDPLWRNDDDRWTFASGIAYLADRLDLVPPHTLQEIEQHFAPNPKELIRAQMGSVVRAAAESFKKIRTGSQDRGARVDIPVKASRSDNVKTAEARDPHAVQRQVGRNDPCPCGSGKKFKRCCMSR